MAERLNVSTGAGGATAVRRNRFDEHVSNCRACADMSICTTAESLWRQVCIAARRARKGGA